MPLMARQGPIELSLEAVAERVGVTRNLLYHYFPEGRGALVAAVVQEAERRTGRSVDRAVHPAAAEQARVRRVDDRIDVLPGDVASHELDHPDTVARP